MFSPDWNKALDRRAFLVFQRIQRFYKTFVVLSALISGLAVAALTFDEFHGTSSGLIHASEGFLCSSAITAVVAAVVATMLLFQFEGLESVRRKELAIAWSPLILLDFSIIEFLVGMVCWYSSKNLQWRGALMATQLAGLMGLCLALSLWMLGMWFMLKETEGQTKPEKSVTTIKAATK
jgi:hypothetical protein